MNPRVFLLVSVAALFIAAWSMDGRHQAAVVLSRKMQCEASLAEATRDVAPGPISIVTTDASIEGSATGSVRLVDHETLHDNEAQSHTGWECFPEHDAADRAREVTGPEESGVTAQSISIERWNALTVMPATIEEVNDALSRPANCSQDSCRNEAASVTEPSVEEVSSGARIDILLPVEIAAGTYRLVSDRGEVRSLTLFPVDIANHCRQEDSTPQDLYTVDAAGSRWYFIRVKDQPATSEQATAAINWQKTADSVNAWMRSDAHIMVWRACASWSIFQRQVSALGRRSQSIKATMTQAFWHTLREIEAANRLSAEPVPAERF